MPESNELRKSVERFVDPDLDYGSLQQISRSMATMDELREFQRAVEERLRDATAEWAKERGVASWAASQRPDFPTWIKDRRNLIECQWRFFLS